jgi:hypothetical protein
MAHDSTILKMNRSPWAVLMLTVLAGASLSCGGRQGPKEVLAPRIEKLAPPSTTAGKGFQVQPSGESAVSVIGSNFTSASQICFNGKPAVTAFGGDTGLSAAVPAELYSREGTIAVTVVNADGRISNAVSFQVFPVAGPPPQLSRTWPDSCVIGRGFNVQPNGGSALGVAGSNFLPGARIYLDETPLETAFGGGTALSGMVPASLLRAPRTAKIRVKNPDGKTSNALDFPMSAGPR